jgi:hypothetical protein
VTRALITFLCVSFCVVVPTYGAPPVAVAKKPILVCPQTDLGNAESQAKYKDMWDKYLADVEVASTTLKAQIAEQTKTATGSGNLELALFWKGLDKDFEQKGELRWDDSVLRRTWNDRFGDASFPSDFSTAVKRASEAYKSAQEALSTGYGEMVAGFTKAEQFDWAVKVRDEIRELLAETAPTTESSPTPMPKPKPEQSKDGRPPKTFVLNKSDLNKQFTFYGNAGINDRNEIECRGGQWSKAVTKDKFALPLRVEFECYAFPDGSFDMDPGVLTDEAGGGGIELHRGTHANTQTHLFIFGNKTTGIPHTAIEPGRVYRIAFDIDEAKKLTIAIDGKVIYAARLPDGARTEGHVSCCGGVGHIAYRGVMIKSKR